MWDNPTMSTTIADAKKRVVIAAVKPGEVFDVQRQDDGTFLLVRLQRPEPVARLRRDDCLRAIKRAPLHMHMRWEALRQITREP
jgi:hypothetical protein